MINEKINRKILAVWNKHFGASDKVYAPIFYDDFKPGGILFIGINPSLKPKGQKKLKKDTEFENLDPEFFRWHNFAANPERVDTSIRMGRRVTTNYRYFARMHEIAKECQTYFQHIDLFVYRHTKQKEFLPFVREGKKKTLNEFGRDQIEVFLEVLKSVRPSVIVVANASASKIVEGQFKGDIAWDDERGFHWFSLNGNRIPIFFSAMLSGGALDNGSYERLLWHVTQSVTRGGVPTSSSRELS